MKVPAAGGQDPLDAPVFIVGPLRSGTTLLRLLLDHHPQINLFGEFELCVNRTRADQWPALVEYHRFLETDREFLDLGLTVDPRLDYESLVRSFLQQLHARNACPVIGGTVHSRMDRLPMLWPRARYIHLYRDPRDVARSCIGMGWVGNVYRGADYWLEAEHRRAQLLDQLPGGCSCHLHFESLVANPERELTRICKFLGLRYSSEMLDIERDTTYGRPDARLAGQWRNTLTAREQALVEVRCGDQMAAQGYQPVQPAGSRPALATRAALNLQNRVYRAGFHIRRWGLPLWMANLLTRAPGLDFLRRPVQHRINAITAQYLK